MLRSDGIKLIIIVGVVGDIRRSQGHELKDTKNQREREEAHSTRKKFAARRPWVSLCYSFFSVCPMYRERYSWTAPTERCDYLHDLESEGMRKVLRGTGIKADVVADRQNLSPKDRLLNCANQLTLPNLSNYYYSTTAPVHL